MFEKITENLTNISNRLRGRAHLSEENIEEVLRELRVALISADVALPVVRDIINNVKTEAIGQKVLQSLSPGQMFIGIFHKQIEKTLGVGEPAWQLRAASPAVILMAGLQGVGKTTQTAKIANWFLKQKKKVLVVSCDCNRPAAIAQLTTLANQVGCDVFTLPNQHTEKPEHIAKLALKEAKARLFDILIVDTAGRLSIDDELMYELANINDVLKPDEAWLTVDAMQGQDAINTAQAFSEKIKITGLILAKADGDSRGGAILSARMVTGAPIRFAGTSEKIDGLEYFDAKRMADRIIGMGDIIGLFEAAQANIDEKVAQNFTNKIRKGKGLTLFDFREQLAQMRKMGDMESILSKMPQQIQQIAKNTPQQFAEKEISRMQGIIDSMTNRERQFPDLLKASRKKRIAEGSGTTVQEVNKLLKQFEQMEKITKKFKGGLSSLGNLAGGLGGMGGMGGLGGMANLNNLKNLFGKK